MKMQTHEHLMRYICPSRSNSPQLLMHRQMLSDIHYQQCFPTFAKCKEVINGMVSPNDIVDGPLPMALTIDILKYAKTRFLLAITWIDFF